MVDGKRAGHTETITDIGKLAVEQDEANFPYTLGRAIARRVVKKGIIYTAKEASKMEKNSWSSVALDVAGVVWEATESADTRCWGLLPEKIQVLRLELPAGTHQIGLIASASDGQYLGGLESVQVHVDEGRNTYVLANFPTTRLAGQVVSSRKPMETVAMSSGGPPHILSRPAQPKPPADLPAPRKLPANPEPPADLPAPRKLPADPEPAVDLPEPEKLSLK
jgi:hypothetical protein